MSAKKPRISPFSQTGKPSERQTSAQESRRRRSRIKAQEKRERYASVLKELADLLPFEESLKASFDKSTILRLAISYLKAKNHFGSNGDSKLDAVATKSTDSNGVVKQPRRGVGILTERDVEGLIMPAMEGFLCITTMDGIIAYISQNVNNYLGLHQHDMMGMNVLNYVHKDDHGEVKEALLLAGIAGSRYSFFCRIKCTASKMPSGVSKSPGYKVVHCSGKVVLSRGAFHEPSLLSVMCPATPATIVEVRMKPGVFTTYNTMNLKFMKVHMNETVRSLFGYMPNDLIGRSMFEFHHVGDLPMCQKCHTELIAKGEGVSGYYRFLRRDGHWVWMQSRAAIIFDSKTAKASCIVITNYVISEDEALRQLAADGIYPNNALPPFPEFAPPAVPYPNDPPLDSPAPSGAVSSVAHSPSSSIPHSRHSEPPQLCDVNEAQDSQCPVRKSSNSSTESQGVNPAIENRDESPIVESEQVPPLLPVKPHIPDTPPDLGSPKEESSYIAADFMAANPDMVSKMMGMPQQSEHEIMMEDLEEFLAQELGPLGAKRAVPWAVVDDDPTGAPQSVFSFQSF